MDPGRGCLPGPGLSKPREARAGGEVYQIEAQDLDTQVVEILQNNPFFIKPELSKKNLLLRYIMLNKSALSLHPASCFSFPSQQTAPFRYVFSSFSPVKFMSIYLKEKNIGKTEERKSDYTYGKP